jgi:tetratricopeptide (TPR) repeat protein
MRRDLNEDLEILRKVQQFAQNRDFDRAAQLAESTLAQGFEHPMLLNVVATRLEQQGRFNDSLRLLQRAVTIAPADIGARNALSLCLQRLDRPAEALPHVDELLKRHPDLSFAHANRGNALIAMGFLGRARESHLRAIELDPNNLAAMASLASIATHRGSYAEAREWAQRALELAPGYPDAVISLAAAEIANGEYQEAERRLQQLILDSRAGASDRARATGLLADLMHVTGRYADAFTAYTTANQALLSIHPRFPGSTVPDYVRGLSTALEAASELPWQRGLDDTATAAEHVFLLGFPRTGTTLLEVVLDGHENVVSSEELELLSDGVIRYMSEPLDLRALAAADDAELRPMRQAYWRRVREAGLTVEGKVFIDKHPLNTLKLPLIAKLFPKARIVFAVRDPRDVVLSCFRRRFKLNPAMYEFLTLVGAASFYDIVMSFAQLSKARLSLDWLEVRYEKVVEDFEGEMRRICAFIGLDWKSSMGDFAARAKLRELSTPSTAQLSGGLTKSAVEQWRHYANELGPVRPVLDRWAARLGYPS